MKSVYLIYYAPALNNRYADINVEFIDFEDYGSCSVLNIS